MSPVHQRASVWRKLACWSNIKMQLYYCALSFFFLPFYLPKTFCASPQDIHENTSFQNGEDLFDPSYLHEIRLYFDQANFWDSLTINYQNWVANQSAQAVYSLSNIEIDGVILDSVGSRLKGLSSYYFVEGLKKPIKIDLNEFVENQDYQGIRKFNLHNGACDPAMMRDFISYNIMRKAGVKAPRVSFTKLFLNDQYWGVYGIIEQIDETFVEANFPSKNGTLIKNVGWSELQWLGADPFFYHDDFEIKMNDTEESWATFIHFLDVLNNTSEEHFADEIQKVFDVNLFLHVLAVDVLLNNWDSYLDNQRNWYLYHEPASGKMQWIPWDYNLALGGTFSTEGNPYPPIDPFCDLITDFTITRDGDTYFFEENSNQETVIWYWEFGDGNTSTAQNPNHVFTGTGKINVCFTGGYLLDDGSICQQKRCKEIDLSFDPELCFTVLAGFCPYPANDPVFQEVIELYEHCCEENWDSICEDKYEEIATQENSTFDLEVDYNVDLPLVNYDSSKILINRILAIPEFREKYLDIVCVMLEKNFNAARLFPILNQQSDLIRNAIYEDPNYIYTWDYFEYDAGDGSGGGGGAKIPALQSVLNQRFFDIENELINWNHDCNNAFSSISWNDLVINEFVADNEEESGILDAADEADDWIEFYNNTTSPIDLSSFYLSDDRNDLFKWNFPLGTSIPPDDYLIVWADKDEDQNGIHCNFKLSKSGESIYLMHEDATIIDSLQFGEQSSIVAYARIPNGLGDFTAQSPTFQSNNENPNSVLEYEERVSFSIFPNPAKDYLYVHFPRSSFEPIGMHFKNLMGQEVLFLNKTTQSKLQIDISHLNPGIYLLEIEVEQNRWIEKIIIE